MLKTRPTSKIFYTYLFQTLPHQINAPRYEKQSQSYERLFSLSTLIILRYLLNWALTYKRHNVETKSTLWTAPIHGEWCMWALYRPPLVSRALSHFRLLDFNWHPHDKKTRLRLVCIRGGSYSYNLMIRIVFPPHEANLTIHYFTFILNFRFLVSRFK